MRCCVEEASEIDANRTWVPKGLGMIRRLTDGSAWALKKGVASCDMLRVGARSLRSGDSQMGLPATVNICGTPYVGGETLGTEASKYEEEEKPRRDSQSSGEQNGKSPNRTLAGNC